MLLCRSVETLVELLNASACINQLLLTREERMALRADLDLYILLRRARLYHVAAGAGDGGRFILRMNTFFHHNSSFPNLILGI